MQFGFTEEQLAVQKTARDFATNEVLPKARRVSGYVQHAVTHALETGEVPHGALVVAAGPKAMMADMRSLGESRRPAGPSIEVLTNV